MIGVFTIFVLVAAPLIGLLAVGACGVRLLHQVRRLSAQLARTRMDLEAGRRDLRERAGHHQMDVR